MPKIKMTDAIKEIDRIIKKLEENIVERERLRAEQRRIDAILKVREIERKYQEKLRKEGSIDKETRLRIEREKEEILRQIKEGGGIRYRVSEIIAVLGYIITIPAILILIVIVKTSKFLLSLAERHEWIRAIPAIPILFIIFMLISYLTITEEIRLVQGLILICIIFALSLVPTLIRLIPHIYEFLLLHNIPARKTTKITVVFVIFTMIIVGAATFQYSETPEFCTNCHIMVSYYLSYQNSSHHKVESCLECHYEPGIIGHVKGKLMGVKSLMQYLTGLYEFPIKANISSDLCLRCHYGNESVDLNSVEFEHVNHEIGDCEQCHGVHDNYSPMKMRDCVYCHEENDVELNKEECDVCHTAGYSPSIEGCLQCHNDMYNKTIEFKGLAFTHEHMGDKLSCTSCHKGNTHGEYYVDRVDAYCLTCHGKIDINWSTNI